MVSDNKPGWGKLRGAGSALLISQLAIVLVASSTIEGSLSVIRISAMLINVGVIFLFYRSLFGKTQDTNMRALAFYKVASIAFALALTGFLMSLWRIGEFAPFW